ncbi:hypothetical protein F9278_23390 [Streptomyces phaeolivaceus]|uniref:Uncharacterized protein n=1 Tax=Streptomyces phaeolivaceus TaxID=2653200 RepID=A0A5P8KIY0_9ACTN|nr:hypothetical protein [Streptomyces phaeolivaceus]QFR02753.1 hypothetical protein F9278_23390 [Streptomyces phaeolivaceus]
MTVAVAVALGLPLAASAGPLGDVPTSERALTSELDRAAGRVGDATGLGAVGGGDATGSPDGSGGDVEKSAGPSAGSSDSSGRTDPKAGGRDEKTADGTDRTGGTADDTADGTAGGTDAVGEADGSSRLLGLGLATAARCGPELTSPDGIEAQTCVLTQGEQTWARTYYRNATGRELSSVLSMMAPGGHTVRMHCAVGAHDEPGVCETPRGRTRGAVGAYTAVAEFAAPDGGGPLLLRSGSNSGRS